MPVYAYKAVTDKGLIVRNKVEESSKKLLIEKLRDNVITPIEVVQVGYKGKGQKKRKKILQILKKL